LQYWCYKVEQDERQRFHFRPENAAAATTTTTTTTTAGGVTTSTRQDKVQVHRKPSFNNRTVTERVITVEAIKRNLNIWLWNGFF
jgi:hypothetical protein